MATLAQLVHVRSQLVEDLRGYYETLIHHRDRTPWYRDNQLVRASEIAIPARVFKEARKTDDRDHHRPGLRPHADNEDDERQQDLTRRSVDPEIAALYEESTLTIRREEAAWEAELLTLAKGESSHDLGDAIMTLLKNTYTPSARLARWMRTACAIRDSYSWKAPRGSAGNMRRQIGNLRSDLSRFVRKVPLRLPGKLIEID